MDILNLTKSMDLSFIEQVSRESGQNPSLAINVVTVLPVVLTPITSIIL